MKRMCYYCGKRPSRHLPKVDALVDNSPGTKCAETYYCSVTCAAADAVRDRTWRTGWCKKHGWYEETCHECGMEERS